MSIRKDQIENELIEIKERIRALSEKGERVPDESQAQSLSSYIKFLVEERERTNKLLVSLTEKVSQLEHKLDSEYETVEGQSGAAVLSEIPLSYIDAKILDFIATSDKSMACADQVKQHMNYKGRNAACARLNALCKIGLLKKDQLGHKVYYRFDAGKATNALIISPPQ